MIKKIAITGHSSGIGSAVMDLLDLTCNGTEIKGYSKSNGWNIADNDGDKIIQELIDFDPDVVVNNAYYPEIQTKILKNLFEEWQTKENDGSALGMHYEHSKVGQDSSFYADENAEYSNLIRAAKNVRTVDAGVKNIDGKRTFNARIEFKDDRTSGLPLRLREDK